MNILVTGGSGFLGTAICRYLQDNGIGSVWAGFYSRRPEFGRAIYIDITYCDSIGKVLQKVKPQLVIHTAYSKEPALYEAVIAKGTQHLAEAMGQTRLIHISTDFVFDGRNGPYDEEDQPCPNTDYGRAKLQAEKQVEKYADNAVIIRTSLIGGADPMPPRWAGEEEKLRRGEKLTFYANEMRNPVHVEDLAGAIIEVAQSDYQGVLHIAGPCYMSRFEELRLFVRWRGISEEMIGSNLSDGKDRPLNCSLKIDRFRQLFKTRLRDPYEYWHVCD